MNTCAHYVYFQLSVLCIICVFAFIFLFHSYLMGTWLSITFALIYQFLPSLHEFVLCEFTINGSWRSRSVTAYHTAMSNRFSRHTIRTMRRIRSSATANARRVASSRSVTPLFCICMYTTLLYKCLKCSCFYSIVVFSFFFFARIFAFVRSECQCRPTRARFIINRFNWCENVGWLEWPDVCAYKCTQCIMHGIRVE